MRDERFSRSPLIFVIAVSWDGFVNESTVTKLDADVVSADDDEDELALIGAIVGGSRRVFGTFVDPS